MAVLADTVSAVWAVLIGTLGGLAGVLIGGALGSRGVTRQWRNDTRLRGFVDYVVMSSARYDRLRHEVEGDMPLDERVNWRNKEQTGRTVVHLVASQETRDAMESLAKHVSATSPDSPPDHHEVVIAALKRFVSAARKELGSRD